MSLSGGVVDGNPVNASYTNPLFSWKGHTHDGTVNGEPKISVGSLTGAAAGRISIGNGATSVAVSFSGSLTGSYGLSYSFENTVDSSPKFLQGMTTSRSPTGFTVALNTDTDSANYKLSYVALEAM